MIEALILVAGACTIFLISCRGRTWRLAGFALGVCQQPLWFYDTWMHGQWGIFLLSIWYLAMYFNGIRNTISAEHHILSRFKSWAWRRLPWWLAFWCKPTRWQFRYPGTDEWIDTSACHASRWMIVCGGKVRLK